MTNLPSDAESETRRAEARPVSVVMPVLNEERHLAASVAGVLAQDHPMEIILAVGPSQDRTEQIARELAAADPRISVVPNPSGTTPDALNLAIAASRYDVIVRVDAHGELAPGYIDKAVDLLESTGAANVGGLMAARGTTPFEKAVAVAYTSKIGLGGGSFHLASSKEGPADTVFLGVFRRDALQAVGGYDPTLLRAQDWELNYRLRKRGETVWFSPELEVTYRPRSTVQALAKQFFKTGQWRREVMRRNPDTISPRYLAPPVAVLGMGAGTALGLVGLATGSRALRLGLLLPAGYAASIGLASALIRRELEPGVRARLPLVLAVMHLAWGAGALKGLPSDQRDRATDPDQP
ncbi:MULTISPECIES: glycosyltransferase family 2 protein [unclassified Luteococcus]|uniref:glycosyltransferase family 2 protein n=1 Tax=unclassified Luteococcus TaxID=2639923 RepID=UPI00313B36EF